MMVARSSCSLLWPALTANAITSLSRHILANFRNQFAPLKFSSLIQSRFFGLQVSHGFRVSPLFCTATEEIMETTLEESDFVDIGYISDVHGLQGEIRVKHNTDFPDLRFGKPGKRWLRLQFSGQERVLEVELVAGRGHPGDKSCIVKLSGFDSVDQAKQLVGATFLVRESDRPELEEGEFYSRDLVGMRVILKDTGELVGTVVNVFDNGANDLLHVMLHPSSKSASEGRNQKSEISKSGQLVWIPFVEAIVPDVDLGRGKMHITPPKGLLELNLRCDKRSKKERRVLEWKERKKFQRRLIAAKKKLCELEQQHIFHGFRYGEKSQRNLLSEQIVSVNSHLLQQALTKALEVPNKGYNGRRSMQDMITQKCGNTLKISEKHLASVGREKLDAYYKHKETGLGLISEGKVATVLMLTTGKSDISSDNEAFETSEHSTISLVETLFSDMQRFVEVEQRAYVPVILILPAHEIQRLEELFASHDYFGFSPEKVRFLVEENLPIVSCSAAEQKSYKMLMKSPWKILQSPLGSGGIISTLSSYNILEDLVESGVEYLELCNINKRCLCGSPIFLGFVSSCEADIGILTFEDFVEDDFHIVLPMKSMKKLMKQMEQLPLQPIMKSNSHVEMVNKEWVDIVPSAPNSYEFRCSIYDLLALSLLEKASLMEVTE